MALIAVAVPMLGTVVGAVVVVVTFKTITVAVQKMFKKKKQD